MNGIKITVYPYNGTLLCSEAEWAMEPHNNTMDLKNIKEAKNQRIKEAHSVVPFYEIQGKVKDIYGFPGRRHGSWVQKSMRERPFRWWGWFRSWLWWGDMCQNSWLNRTLKMVSLYHRLYLNKVDLKSQLCSFPRPHHLFFSLYPESHTPPTSWGNGVVCRGLYNGDPGGRTAHCPDHLTPKANLVTPRFLSLWSSKCGLAWAPTHQELPLCSLLCVPRNRKAEFPGNVFTLGWQGGPLREMCYFAAPLPLPSLPPRKLPVAPQTKKQWQSCCLH